MFKKIFALSFIATVAATIVDRLFGKPARSVNRFARRNRRA
ncbi:MAG TPA: hypothetical protein VFB16_03240 [Bauldia sp.]|nr:hypothetical protein [Bauldia sp.]